MGDLPRDVAHVPPESRLRATTRSGAVARLPARLPAAFHRDPSPEAGRRDRAPGEDPGPAALGRVSAKGVRANLHDARGGAAGLGRRLADPGGAGAADR